VQTRLGRPRGLLSFTSETRLEGGRSSYLPYLRRRVRVYGSLWALALGALIFLLARRADAEVELLRSTRAPFEVLPSGEIATSLRVRVTNLRRQPQSFTLERLEPEEARIAGGEQTLTVAPQEVENLLVSVVLPRASFADGRATVWLRLRSDLGFVEESPFLLLGPYR
jgi:polyferredoxin